MRTTATSAARPDIPGSTTSPTRAPRRPAKGRWAGAPVASRVLTRRLGMDLLQPAVRHPGHERRHRCEDELPDGLLLPGAERPADEGAELGRLGRLDGHDHV